MPTVGRLKEPERFLASLDAQTFRGFELLAVDQNPDERLAPVLGAYGELFPVFHLRERRAGASRARNVGLRHSSGLDIVAFPDDDCQYPPLLLEKVARFFEGNPEIDGLTGRLVDERGESSILDFDSEPGLLDTTNVWIRSIEATIFLRRDSVRELRFDENLGRGSGTTWGSGEGTDFLLQLLSKGASLYYDPHLSVYHPSPVPPYDAKAMQRAYEYGCGRGHVLRKHKYPLHAKAQSLVGPLGRAAVAAAGLRLAEAGYQWNVLRGRMRGLISAA